MTEVSQRGGLNFPPIPPEFTPEAQIYEGFDRRLIYGVDALALGANPSTVVVPGPAAGFVRFFNALQAVTEPTVGATLEWLLKPQAMFIQRAAALAANSFSAVVGAFQAPFVLAHGETIEVTNTGLGTCSVAYSYVDLPATDLTVVRVVANDNTTPTVIVPAAPAGYCNRLSVFTIGPGQLSGAWVTPRFCLAALNDDTAANNWDLYRGANRIARSVSANANQTAAPMAGLEQVTADALKVAPRVAVTTAPRGWNIFGCYETRLL